MTLLLETLAISMCMILFSGLPLFSATIRRYSGLFFLIGTGALTGILFLDLLPDLFEMGGSSTLWGVGIVWVVYSVFHLSHIKSHEKHHEEHHVHEVEARAHEHRHSPWFFLTSMIGHCLASGVMLVASDGLTETNRAVASSFPVAINNGLLLSGINRTVFLALLAHKAYEALTVSSVLVENQGSQNIQNTKKRVLLPIALYSLSLPVGVILTLAFRSYITQSIAVIAMSLAAGTLLGCLVHDFFIPSLAQIKSRRTDLVWIMFGFGLTQVMMRAL